MQEKTVQSALFLEFSIQCKISVAGISQKRVPDMRHVYPYLMGSSRLEIKADKRAAVAVFYHVPVSDGGLNPFFI